MAKVPPVAGASNNESLPDDERNRLLDRVASKLRAAAAAHDPTPPPEVARLSGPYNPAANVADIFRGDAPLGSEEGFEAARWAQVSTARVDYLTLLEQVRAARREDQDAARSAKLRELLETGMKAALAGSRALGDLQQAQIDLLLHGIDQVISDSGGPTPKVTAGDVDEWLTLAFFRLHNRAKRLDERMRALGVGRGGATPKREKRARAMALKAAGLVPREIAAIDLGLLSERRVPIRRKDLARADRQVRSLLDRARDDR